MSMQHNAKSGKEDSHNWHVARLPKHGIRLEVVINPDEAMAFIQGTGSLEDAVQVMRIFTDAKKGLEASEEQIEKVTGKKNLTEAIEVILKEGDVQLSPEYRKKKKEEKHRQIIDWIHRHAVNPTTAKKLPHPPDRIEAAMEEAKVRIDENQTVDQQVEKIVDQLKPILPIVVMTKTLRVVIPAEHAARCYKLVHSIGKVLKEGYGQDGSWEGTIEIPGGMEPDFYDRLNKATHGNNQVTVIQ